MRRVLDNLIGNAIKFTPAGGRVTVDFSRSAETILCTVSDTGVGIAPDQLEHIFDRFYTSSSTSTGNPPGSGLGLHIVRRLVELHGGEIAVESRPGDGTVFRFHFPSIPRLREASGIQMAPSEPEFEPLPPAHDILSPPPDDSTESAPDLPPLPPGDPLLDDPEEEGDEGDEGDKDAEVAEVEDAASETAEEPPGFRVIRPAVPPGRFRQPSSIRDHDA